MSYNTTIFIFAWLGLTLVSVFCVTASTDLPSRPCSEVFNCTNEKDVVYSTDGSRCLVWMNPCHLARENCRRLNEYLPELNVIKKKECRKLCKEIVCTAIYSPVCAEYNGKFQTFGNPCRLEVYICTTGKPYSVVSEGECAGTNV